MNNTDELGNNDPYLRATDNIEITVDFWCSADGDAYNILYKNSTNSNGADWRFLKSGTCISDHPNYYSQTVPVTINLTLDDIARNHTIRAMISYSSQVPGAICGNQMDDPDYSDTDDLVIEVIEKKDSAAPEISILSPISDGSKFEFGDETVWINFTVSDQTGIDFVNVTLSHDGINQSLNLSNISDFYFTNLNISSLGLYELFFFVNDSVPTTNFSINHINNYTSTFFYLVNEKSLKINSPLYYIIQGQPFIYPALDVVLDFTIKDPLYPFQEVYYIHNEFRNNLSESKHINIDYGINYFNNSNKNLSQSFTPTFNMNIYDLSFYIKRIGDSNSYSSIVITDDNGGTPFGTLKAYKNFTSVSNSSFQWYNFSLTSPINLTSGIKYWVTLIDEASNYLLWSYNNTYILGEGYPNSSIDFALKFFDLYNYNTTLNSVEGKNTLSVCENNSIPAQLECSYVEYKSDTTPPYYGTETHSNNVELGFNNKVFIEFFDETSFIEKVLISFNGTNFSTTKGIILPKGAAYSYTFNNLKIGKYNYSFFANDTTSRYNQTLTYFFNVTDSTPPSLTTISYYPNSSEIVDPNISISFNFTLNELDEIASTVYFQYKTNITNWTSINATNLGNNKYTTNFTPYNETIYYYRVNAFDLSGNELNSTTKSFNVSYERKWRYNPLTFSTILIEKGSTEEIYNFTIENFGDVPLNLTLKKNPTINKIYDMYFINENISGLGTYNFLIDKNESKFFSVNVTAPFIDDEYPATTLITCENNCNLENVLLGDSFIVGGVGPWLSLTIKKKYDGFSEPLYFPVHKVEYYKMHEFVATVENIGRTYSAENVSFKYIISNQSGWPGTVNNTGNLTANFDLGPVEFINNSKDISLKIYIDRTTQIGKIFNLTINAGVIFNGTLRERNFTIGLNISNVEEVIDNTTYIISSNDGGGTTPSTPPSIPSGNNGGNQGSPGAGASGSLIDYNLGIFMNSNLDLQRGTNKTFQINLTNIFKNKVFKNISWELIGYYSNQIIFTPNFINNLSFNETKQINLTIIAPNYMSYSVRDINLIFDYFLGNEGGNGGKNDSTNHSFRLIINEVNREDSLLCLEKSTNILLNVTNQNFSINSFKNLIDNQRDAIVNMDFTLATKMCKDMENLFDSVINFKERILSFDNNIKEKIDEGYDMSNVNDLLNLAKNSFEKGEYDKLDNSLKEIENLYLLQITLEDANLIKRFFRFISNNLFKIIQVIILLSILGTLAVNKLHKIKILNNIKNLETEKKDIGFKFTKLQNDYFKDKKVSNDYFKIHTKMHKERIAEINSLLTHYKHVKSKFNGHSLEDLENEEKEIEGMLKDIQNHYYLEKSIDKTSYDKSSKNFKKTLGKIKNQKNILLEKEKNNEKNKYYVIYKKYLTYFLELKDKYFHKHQIKE